MRFQTHQAILTLIRDNLSRIEACIEEVKHGYDYWYRRAVPGTEGGAEAYKELNRLKNRLRLLNDSKRRWVEHYREFKIDMQLAQDDMRADSRLAQAFEEATKIMNSALDKFR